MDDIFSYEVLSGITIKSTEVGQPLLVLSPKSLPFDTEPTSGSVNLINSDKIYQLSSKITNLNLQIVTNKSNISIISSNVKYISGIVDTKADQIDLNTVSSNVSRNVKYISGIVDTKADQIDLNTVSSNVSRNVKYISGIVDTKADQIDLNTVSSNINTLKTSTSFNSDNISEISSFCLENLIGYPDFTAGIDVIDDYGYLVRT